MNSNKWSRLSGFAGLVIFLFGIFGSWAVGFNFESSLILLPLAHLIVGAVLILLWLVTVGLRNIANTKEVATARTTRFGANALVYSILFIGLLGVINYLVYKHDRRWDLTEQGVYSLSSQSQKVVKDLKKPLKIVGVKLPNPNQTALMKDTLDLYRYHNSNITIDMIDPESKPFLVDQYQLKTGNMIYLAYGEGDSKVESRLNDISEQTITNAIIKLTRSETKKAYYVTGHGEPSLDSDGQDGLKTFADAVKNEHLKIENILLGQFQSVPEDAAAVMLVSPKKGLLPQEKEMLIKYANEGGRLLLFTDPRTTNDIKEIAAAFNITVGNDIVLDRQVKLFSGPVLGFEPLIRSFGEHAISEGFNENTPVIFSEASSVSAPVPGGSNQGIYVELAKTQPGGWAETNLGAIYDSSEPSADLNPEDKKGPVSLAVAYEKRLEDSSNKDGGERVTRVVVFGDSDWLTNSRNLLYANQDFGLNAVNWVAGEESSISIRPARIKESAQMISQNDQLNVALASFLVPEFILLLGVFVWWRRKSLSAV